MLTTLLLIVALVLAIMALANVPSRINLLAVSMITTIVALLLPNLSRLL